MSNIVKLSSSDARAWTHNQPLWVDSQGNVTQPVTREEQHAISKTLEKAARVKQSFKAKLPLLPLNRTGRRATARRGEPVQTIELAFEVTFIGEKRVVTVWKGDHRYATGREVLAARLLADHGECILHGRNGKCIGYLRDPYVRDRPPPTGPRVQWSRNPLDPRKNEAQRSELTDAASQRRVAPEKRRRQRIPPQTRASVQSPQKCPNDCRGYRGGQAWKIGPTATPPSEVEHHPMCKFAVAWAATLENPETTEVLYDLETSRVMRTATPGEIEQADEALARTNIRQVTLGDRVYAVLSRAEAEQAAREARGEVDESPGELPEGEVEEDEGEVDLPTPVRSTSSARGEWPSLDELSPRRALPSATNVSTRDYLARTPIEVSESP